MALSPQIGIVLRLVPARRIAALGALMVASGLTDGVGLLLLVPLIESLLASGGGITSPVSTAMASLGLPQAPELLLGGFIVLIALRVTLQYLREVMAQRMQLDAADRLRERCVHALLGAELGWHQTQRRADQISLLTVETRRVGAGLQMLVSLAATVISGLAFLAAALWLSPGLTTLAVAFGGVTFAVLRSYRARARALGSEQSQASAEVMSVVGDSLAGLRLIRSLGAEDRSAARIAARTRALRGSQQAFTEATARARALATLMAAMGLSLFVWTGLRVLSTEPAVLLALVAVFARITSAFTQVQSQLATWLHTLPVIERIDALRQGALDHAAPEAPQTLDPLRPVRSIAVRDVTVAGAPGQPPRLDGVNLVLDVGSVTLLTGPSGAGKSTLADVIGALIVPGSGALLVDGTPITPETRRAWMRSVSYIP
ncbi:ABC transporter ATP-binding protein/permease [Rhodobacteraceae bacterium ASV31]|nr:ABC transporter ATP-binding protein/permease [Anianabacter salinae]